MSAIVKTKKLNPTTKPRKAAKISPRSSNDYQLIYAFKQKPVSDAFLNQLAWELITWAKNEKARDLQSFLVQSNIAKRSFSTWCNRNQRLDEARDFAKMCIASNLFEGAVTRKYDAGIVSKVMPMYSDEWKHLNEWYAKLKENHDQKNGNITVIIPPFKAEEKPKEVAPIENKNV